jgi:hypothetical protein
MRRKVEEKIQDTKASGIRRIEWLREEIAGLNQKLAEYEEFDGLLGVIVKNDYPG